MLANPLTLRQDITVTRCTRRGERETNHFCESPLRWLPVRTDDTLDVVTVGLAPESVRS